MGRSKVTRNPLRKQAPAPAPPCPYQYICRCSLQLRTLQRPEASRLAWFHISSAFCLTINGQGSMHPVMVCRLSQVSLTMFSHPFSSDSTREDFCSMATEFLNLFSADSKTGTSARQCLVAQGRARGLWRCVSHDLFQMIGFGISTWSKER